MRRSRSLRFHWDIVKYLQDTIRNLLVFDEEGIRFYRNSGVIVVFLSNICGRGRIFKETVLVGACRRTLSFAGIEGGSPSREGDGVSDSQGVLWRPSGFRSASEPEREHLRVGRP